MGDKISFLRLEAAYIDTLLGWLKKPHIVAVWDQKITDALLRQRLQKHIESKWMHPFVIALNEKPIGYLQAYDATHEGSEIWPNESIGTFGIDIFIGEPGMLHKGYGSTALRYFMSSFEQAHKVAKWITCVNLENSRAIHFYENTGFRQLIEIDTPNGPSILMTHKKMSGLPFE